MITISHDPSAPFVVVRKHFIQYRFASAEAAIEWMYLERNENPNYDKSEWTLYNTTPVSVPIPFSLLGRVA